MVTRFEGLANMTRATGVCDFCGSPRRSVYTFYSHTPTTQDKAVSLCRSCIEADMTWEADLADERAEGGDDASH